MAAPTITGSVSYGATVGTDTSFIVSHTSNGDALWVLVVITSPGSLLRGTCTFDGTPLDFVGQIAAQQASGPEYQIFAYCLSAPDAITGDIEYTPDPLIGAVYIALAGYNVNGAVVGTRFTEDNSTSNNTPSVSQTGFDDELFLDLVASDAANNVYTVGAGQTSLFEMENAETDAIKLASSTKPTSSTVTMSWTINDRGSGWAQWMIALIGTPSGSGGGSGEHSAVF